VLNTSERDRQPGERRKASNALNTDEVDGRTGDKGGKPGTSNVLNMSEEGTGDEGGQLRGGSSYVHDYLHNHNICYVKIYIIGLCQNFFVPSLVY